MCFNTNDEKECEKNNELLRKKKEIYNVTEYIYMYIYIYRGVWALWLSGKALDSEQRRQGFETYLRRDMSLVLEQDTLLLERSGNTLEDVAPSRHD